jgi:hypothetical protein
MTTKAKAQRDSRLRSLTEMVQHFDPSNGTHLAHYNALKVAFGEMGAAMLVSQDAAGSLAQGIASGEIGYLELTDPGAINSHPGWRKLNRVVRHGEVSRYTMFDFDADTQVGGRLIPMFTRDQTVPAFHQPE